LNSVDTEDDGRVFDGREGVELRPEVVDSFLRKMENEKMRSTRKEGRKEEGKPELDDISFSSWFFLLFHSPFSSYGSSRRPRQKPTSLEPCTSRYKVWKSSC